MKLYKLLLLTIISLIVINCTPEDIKDDNEDFIPPSGSINFELEESSLVATNPEFITDSYEKASFTIDVRGTSFESYSGDIYAHTGLITEESTAPNEWKYAPNWGDNDPKYKLIQDAVIPYFYTLTFPEGARKFFSVAEEESIHYVAFVFRSSDNKIELKDEGKDIFVKIYSNDLAVKFTSPKNDEMWKDGTKLQINATSSHKSNLKLYLNEVDGTPLASSTNGNLSYEYICQLSEPNFKFVVEATYKGKVVYDTLVGNVLVPSEQEVLPQGAKDGVSIDGNSATFVLYAPGKKNVMLLGDFNDYKPNSDYQLKSDGDYFWIRIEGIEENKEYGYQYLVDGKIRVADPYSEMILDPWNDKYISSSIYPNLKVYPEGKTTGMVSVFSTSKDEYIWEVDDFQSPPQKSLAIYELLVRDFTVDGSILAVKEKLDYLEKLGINAIELMPVQEFSGNDSWGYNPMFYFAMDKAYGTRTAYKEFIDECHRRGIAVILDVVFNHAESNFPWLAMWMDNDYSASSNNPFFNKVAKHPFNVFNDFNHEYPKTKEYFCDVLQYMLKEYRFDGFRFDLSKGFTQKNSGGNVDAWGKYDQSRIDIIKTYADAIREVSDDAYIILEHLGERNEEDALAAYEDIMLWRKASNAYYETAMGWAIGHGGTNSSDLGSLLPTGRINNIEDHDEERLAYKSRKWGKNISDSGFNTEVYKNSYSSLSNVCSRLGGLYALHFLSPGAKMMWQFGELAYDYNIDFNGRTGKKPVKWDYLSDNDKSRAELYEEISKIITFRTDNESMYNTEYESNSTLVWEVGDKNIGAKTLVFSSNGKSVIVVSNFTSTTTEKTIKLPETGIWTDLITGESRELNEENITFDIPANDYLILVK